MVEDSQQRRGLGSILLEHLAAAAQERGIRRFTAEVLSENTQMVRVFIDAGYTVNREYDSGVVDLVFDIEPTEKSRAVITSREHRAEARSIARLLSPRSIAVIGASDEPTKLGHAVLVNLLRGNFSGPVYPVNPDAVSVQGVRAYATVTDIPDPVDLAVVTVPAATVAEVVEACRAKGVHGLVVMTAGFADNGIEAGDLDGAGAQRQMVAVARAAGMRVLGPELPGPGQHRPDGADERHAGAGGPAAGPDRLLLPVRRARVSRSWPTPRNRGLGLSTFVSAGNRADVSGNDLLQFWHGDDRTEVVLLYLESFGNPRKFARLARVLARTKPVIAVKSGRHARVTPGLAASSAPLSEAAVATLFEQSGVIRTPDLTTAFDVAQLLSTQPVPVGDRVAHRRQLQRPGHAGRRRLPGRRPAGRRRRPRSTSGSTSARRTWPRRSGRRCSRPDVDALVVVYVPPVATPGAAHAAALRDAVAGSPCRCSPPSWPSTA